MTQFYKPNQQCVDPITCFHLRYQLATFTKQTLEFKCHNASWPLLPINRLVVFGCIIHYITMTILPVGTFPICVTQTQCYVSVVASGGPLLYETCMLLVNYTVCNPKHWLVIIKHFIQLHNLVLFVCFQEYKYFLFYYIMYSTFYSQLVYIGVGELCRCCFCNFKQPHTRFVLYHAPI